MLDRPARLRQSIINALTLLSEETSFDDSYIGSNASSPATWPTALGAKNWVRRQKGGTP
jgi:hypothetical protein